MSLQSQIFLRSNFKTLSVGWPGFEPATSARQTGAFPNELSRRWLKMKAEQTLLDVKWLKITFNLIVQILSVRSTNVSITELWSFLHWGSICPFHRGELFVWGVQRVWNHCWSYSPLRPSSLASDTCWADSSSFVALIPLSIRRNFQSYARTENCQACRWKQINSGTSNYPKCISKTTGEQGTNYLHRIMMLERKKKKLTSDWRQTANKNTEIDKRIVLQVAVSCMWSTLHPWKGWTSLVKKDHCS